MKENYAPIRFRDGVLSLLDQRQLPTKEVFWDYDSLEGGFNSIKDMVVRGAPCIGFTGIFSIALWLKNHDFDVDLLQKAADFLKSARPTAVNLAYEVDRAVNIAHHAFLNKRDAYSAVVEFGHEQIENSEVINRAMADFAKQELESVLGRKKYNLLTHCNTGFLACGSIGTALGVVQHLAENDLLKHVWVDETRPYLQGSRLTSYELNKLKIPHHIVVEGAATYLMSQGLVDAIFVGADRIVGNGDTANKIGTANLSIIAKYFNIPFYVVAPLSTFDVGTTKGADIEIELRPQEEILKFHDFQIAPFESEALNPSFDVTYGENITGIICEKGLLKGDYSSAIKKVMQHD